MHEVITLREALALTFAAVYLFSFREATKLAAEWGAFQFKNNQLAWQKFARCSVPLLMLLPLFMYVPYSKVVAGLTVNSSVGGWRLLRHLVVVASVILLLGLFPRATKHVWNLIARRMVVRGAREGEAGDGWFNPNKQIEKDLPDPWYSWQVVVVLGMLPLTMAVYYLIPRGFRILVPGVDDLRNLYVAAYGGLCVVLHHMAKMRKYFYAGPRPKWLLSVRMLLTVPITILLPLVFGMLAYLWVLAFAREPDRYRVVLGTLGLIVALPFPLYCNQSVLLLARRQAWATKEECPELYEGHTWPWSVCLALAVICVTGMFYTAVRHWSELTVIRPVAFRQSEPSSSIFTATTSKANPST